MPLNGEVSPQVKAVGKGYTPIEEEIASQTANKIPWFGFGIVRGTQDTEHAGRLLVDVPGMPHGPQPCDYMSPVGGAGYGLFALPGIDSIVLVGQVPYADPPTKYFWMGCLYHGGQQEMLGQKTQPYYVGEKDPEAKQQVRQEVDPARPAYNHSADSEITYGCPNADTAAVYGSNDLPDSYVFKHPAGHMMIMSDKKSDVVINEFKIKSALNKRIVLNDAPGEGGDCIQIADENDNTIQIGNSENSNPNSILATAKGNVELTSQNGKIDLTVQNGSNNIELDNMGTGDITIHAMGGATQIKAANEITLKCGSSSIKLSPDGITINAPNINMVGNGDVRINNKSLPNHTHNVLPGGTTTPPK
tara:strand:- start:11471 stop:12553 length:1083 start_codon:yes stop_codon:yes gene_type:complete